MREAVAAEELPQAERVRRVARPDQDHVALLGADQRHAAKDERAHEELAQFGVALHQPPQAVVLDLDHLAVFAYTDTHGGARPAQRAHLAGKIPGVCTVISFSPASPGRTISIAPERTTSRRPYRSPGFASTSPARMRPRFPYASSRRSARRELREHLLPPGLAEIRHQRPSRPRSRRTAPWARTTRPGCRRSRRTPACRGRGCGARLPCARGRAGDTNAPPISES